MERQKLMDESDSKKMSINNCKHKFQSETKNKRNSEQFYSLIENGRAGGVNSVSSDSKINSKRDKTYFMNVFNLNLFGVKTNRRDKSLAFSTTVIFVLSVLSTLCVYIDATPVNSGRQSVLFNLSPSARNIRHLPCVSRRTKEEGTCMFAIDCLKANGTHLGTCIDRFYFGSCCQMPEDVPQITDNHIEDNSISGQDQHKPNSGSPEEKIDDNSLSPLLSSSSTSSQSTSHKTVPTIAHQTTKPYKISSQNTIRTSSTTQSALKPSPTTSKPPSQRPTFSSSHRPTFTTNKFGSTTSKFNTTKQDTLESITKRPNSTIYTRKPYPSTITRKPITTGVIVNNTIYSGKLPAVNASKDPVVNEPVTVPTMKPMRLTTIQSTTVQQNATLKPSYLSTRLSTTQRPKNITQSVGTVTSPTPTRFSTTQFIQETKKTTYEIQETTTPVTKLSTFHSVQDETKKPTSGTKKPIITGKPTPSSNLGPHLPFGTRLPSGSSTSYKPSTSIKPSSTVTQTTQTKPSSTTISDTIPPLVLTPTRPTHKPFQKPTTIQTTEKPIQSVQPNLTITSERPLVQRPQNSTLSNRRPTTKPTTPFKKPTIFTKPTNVTAEEPTKKPTTVVFRPSMETRPSLKPTFVSHKPSEETQKPTISITFRPSTIFTRRPVTTETSVQSTSSSIKPASESYRPSSWTPTRPSSSTINATKIAATSSPPDTTISLSSSISTSSTPTSTTNKPISPSPKPSTVTKKPLFKPSSTYVPVKPSTVTKKPVISPKPEINQFDDALLSQKPTTLDQKPLTSTIMTTEKIGLVTWTNFVEPAATSSPPRNTTQKDEVLTTPTSSESWVILQTITHPSSLSTVTQVPSTISSTLPTRRPTTTRPKPTRRPVVTSTLGSTSIKIETTTKGTTAAIETTPEIMKDTVQTTVKPLDITSRKPTPESTNKPVFEFTTRTPIPETTTKPSVEETKPIFTVHVTTKPLQKPSTTTQVEQKPDVEFSSTLSVSESPATKPSVTMPEKNFTSTVSAVEGSTESVMATEMSENTTATSQTGSTVFGTTPEANATILSNATEATVSSSTIAGAESYNMSDYKDVCGRRLWPEARVVGGSKANFGKWPWQVSLRQWRTSTYLHKCGAALLSENWAITAAHCVDNVPPSDLLLRLGEHDLASEDEPYGYQERRVQIVASHPQFDPRTFEYDLALLRFYEPVNFQPNILPVCVPTNDESFVGKTGFVTGWGRLYEDGPLPSVLQEVRVPVLENEACEQMYRVAGYIEHIPHIFICAGWRKGGFDSCEGDSGGPLVLQRDDNRFQLAGIISWGIGCAEPNQPGVYTRISEFRDWINQILQF